jgi:L-threonylcarbamoyladenylate synthase
MKTKILNLTISNQDEVADEILLCLKKEEPVIIPTDTVYGFFAPGNSPFLEEKVRRIKVRDKKPFIYLVSNFEMLKKYSKTKIPDEILKKLPSAITLIVESSLITTKDGSIALRYPDNSFLNTIVKKTGFPCISTSANISGEPLPQTNELLISQFKNKVPLIVLSSSANTAASTIADIRTEEIKILRQGSVYL